LGHTSSLHRAATVPFLPAYLLLYANFLFGYVFSSLPCFGLVLVQRCQGLYKKSTRIWLFVLLGITYGIGAELKFTISICFLAMLLDTVWRSRFKLFALPFLLALFLMAFTKIAFKNYIYHTILDPDIALQKSVPYIHWIAMGTQGYGNFRSESLVFSMSLPPEGRVNGNIQLIKNKLKEYGIEGYIRFLTVKGVHSFGSGVYGVYQILDDEPKNHSFLHKIVLLDGKYFPLFNYVCQGWHLMIFILIVLSAFLDTKSKNINKDKDLFLRFSILGIYLFLLIWEANPRYLVNFLPVFILCATKGIITISDLLSKSEKLGRPNKKATRVVNESPARFRIRRPTLRRTR
jgi:hypothetical protein